MAMISKEQKKDAISKFKERKARAGVFAVRSAQSGTVWVGTSRNLDAAKNGIWFSLRIGAHRDKPLQNEWNAARESALSYEVIESIEDNAPALLVPDLLKAAKQRWITSLSARELL